MNQNPAAKTTAIKMSTPNITLYMLPGTCAIVPHVLLNQAGLNFKLEPVPPANITSTFSSTNPKQQVPVLVINEDIITENPAIAQAINQLAPSAYLFGTTPLQFIRVCEWLNYLSAAIHAQAWGPYLRPHRYTNDPAAEAGIKAACWQKLRDRFALIESKLPEEGWAVGTVSMTAVDAYLLPFYQWASRKDRMGIEMESEYPKWTALMGRLQGLESVRRTLEEIERVRVDMGLGV
jgi:glutathione S-transferase